VITSLGTSPTSAAAGAKKSLSSWTRRPPYVKVLPMASERVSELRITVAVAHVLAVFLNDASQPRYGYELMQVTGYPSGKLYPIMARLAHAGWLTREREDIDPGEEGRPARYMYRLTEQGNQAARYELAALRQKTETRSAGLVPGLWPAGGRA
jgi:PadR family transcriptional regulator, regulatory protein PadR